MTTKIQTKRSVKTKNNSRASQLQFFLGSKIPHLIKKLIVTTLAAIFFVQSVSASYLLTPMDEPTIVKIESAILYLSEDKPDEWMDSAITFLHKIINKNEGYGRLVAVLTEVINRLDIGSQQFYEQQREGSEQKKNEIVFSEPGDKFVIKEKKSAHEVKEEKDTSMQDQKNEQENKKELEQKTHEDTNDHEIVDSNVDTENTHGTPHLTLLDKINGKTGEEPIEVEQGPYINHDEVEAVWIGWVNDLRKPRGLEMYSRDLTLRDTAKDWSLSLSAKGIADHRRFSTSSYYDYKEVTKRFGDRGVIFENHEGSTSTENIGRASYSCDLDDCTKELSKSLKRIFNFFAAEEADNGVHRRTMIHPRFRVVGVSFTINEEEGKVYAVMHYGTRVAE